MSFHIPESIVGLYSQLPALSDLREGAGAGFGQVSAGASSLGRVAAANIPPQLSETAASVSAVALPLLPKIGLAVAGLGIAALGVYAIYKAVSYVQSKNHEIETLKAQRDEGLRRHEQALGLKDTRIQELETELAPLRDLEAKVTRLKGANERLGGQLTVKDRAYQQQVAELEEELRSLRKDLEEARHFPSDRKQNITPDNPRGYRSKRNMKAESVPKD